MASTTWPAAVDAIIAALRNDLTVPVFDGADDDGFGDQLRAFVVVGASVLDDGYAGSFTQEYHDLGPTATRDDAGTIGCVVVAQSGDQAIKPLRDAAFDALADVEATLRADVGLGVSSALRIELGSGQISQGRSEDGYSFCEVRFELTYQALI